MELGENEVPYVHPTVKIGVLQNLGSQKIDHDCIMTYFFIPLIIRFIVIIASDYFISK